ncbi:MAG TPA: cyclase family protein [Alphaproteobacteria bacterium]|nr:cyclase family protein [Alphaproteobacteria bacterium]
MPRIIDLTMPIEPHFRWRPKRELKGDFARGDRFQVTWLGLTVHGFTHIDAPRHIDPAGETTDAIALERTTGPASVIGLDGIAPDTAITGEMLAAKGGHVAAGEIVLIRTNWDRRRDHHTPAFWADAPYMTRGACAWLGEHAPKAVGFDFPQDYPIRGLLGGEAAAIEDFVTHDLLLRHGVVLIEYLCNMGEIGRERVTLYALPLKLPGADGAPARVVAVEE